MTAFGRILVANRGEIALRVFRAARELGIGCVAVYSEADRDALHVRRADDAYLLGPGAPSESYLNQRPRARGRPRGRRRRDPPGLRLPGRERVVRAPLRRGGHRLDRPAAPTRSRRWAPRSARASSCWRPASRSSRAPPSASTIRPACVELGEAVRLADRAQGRGRRRRQGPARSCAGAGRGASARSSAAQREGAAVLRRPGRLRREVPRRPAPRRGAADGRHARHRGVAAASATARSSAATRRSSRRRRRRPSTPEIRARARRDGGRRRAGRRLRRRGHDRVPDGHAAATCYFLEMNTRIQVEHPITEMVTGIDLVREQILVAQGEPLSFAPGRRRAARPRHRVPHQRRGPGARLPARHRAASRATASRPGRACASTRRSRRAARSSALYDPMVAKLVVWDRDRDLARARMRRALDEMVVEGVRTLIPLHRLIMDAPGVRARRDVRGPRRGRVAARSWPPPTSRSPRSRRPARSRSYVAEVDGRRFEVRVHAPDDPVLVEARAAARRARSAGGGAAAGEGAVTSPMQGTRARGRGGRGRRRRGRPGDRHRRGDEDGERDHRAARRRRRASLAVAAGDSVASGQAICRISDG